MESRYFGVSKGHEVLLWLWNWRATESGYCAACHLSAKKQRQELHYNCAFIISEASSLRRWQVKTLTSTYVELSEASLYRGNIETWEKEGELKGKSTASSQTDSFIPVLSSSSSSSSSSPPPPPPSSSSYSPPSSSSSSSSSLSLFLKKKIQPQRSDGQEIQLSKIQPCKYLQN